jgi:hypothetical protein
VPRCYKSFIVVFDIPTQKARAFLTEIFFPTLRVRSHMRFGSSNFAERCDFNRNPPIFSNRHCWRQRQHVMFSRLCKHHLTDKKSFIRLAPGRVFQIVGVKKWRADFIETRKSPFFQPLIFYGFCTKLAGAMPVHQLVISSHRDYDLYVSSTVDNIPGPNVYGTFYGLNLLMFIIRLSVSPFPAMSNVCK